jgi:hypothetical protein
LLRPRFVSARASTSDPRSADVGIGFGFAREARRAKILEIFRWN